jgi:hypothetical protein
LLVINVFFFNYFHFSIYKCICITCMCAEMEVCPMIDVLSIMSTSRCCTITNQHRVDIGNTSFTSSTSHCSKISCWHCKPLILFTSLYDIESTSCRHCKPFLWFTSFTSSILRCYTISNQHRVYIVNLSSCLYRSNCRHRDGVRYQINIVSTL